ncbi:MAG TPA: nitroreductase family protein [Spirochaetota bacterium]|nr:nitroreductase family protein [Spirochaetota bacterium]
MELHEAIMTRRSVRKFTDYVVTDEEIMHMMKAAQCAPSWSNTQCWEFIIVRERGLVHKIVETYSETNPARKCSESASVLIACCARSDLPGYRDGAKRTKFDSWYMFDLGIAVQNIMLKAHDMGLGTVVVGSINHTKCAELLGVKPPYELVCILPVGRPVELKKEGPARRDVNEFTHNEMFGKK